MKTLRFLVLIKAAFWLPLLMTQAKAEEGAWFTPTQWEAFVSQSAIYSSDYNFLSQSDDQVSFDMWEAGFLFSSRIKGDLSFSAQVLGRQVSEFSGNDIRVDYGFFSYPFYQSAQSTVGIRLGRIRSSYGFYNETRDIPHNRTGIVMPQAVYFDMTRNSFYSADGVELFGSRDFGDQQLTFQVFYSKPVTDKDEAQEAASLEPQNLEGDKGLLAKIGFGSEFEGWRASFTYYRPEYDIDISLPHPFFLNESIPVNGASFYSENMVTSLEYNQLNWSVTGEYLRHKFHTSIPVLGEDVGWDIYEEAYYVQGLYRFSEQWESYLRFEQTKVRNFDDNPGSYFDDVNLGASFRPDEHWLLRAEAHYIEGRSRLLSRDNPVSPAQDPYWTAVLFQVAYRW